MKKKPREFDFSIDGITQNNLKNVNFSGQLGTVILVTGVSGSGKSTLVNDVIVTEAKRQAAMRQKTDDLFVYAVRPDFLEVTELPECTSVSQRALTQTEHSTFGTRTGLKAELQRLFVEKGIITYHGVHVKKPSLAEIRLFAHKFHSNARLYAVLWTYSAIKARDVQLRLAKHAIKAVFLRDEQRGTFREVALDKLPKTDLSNFEISIALDACSDDRIAQELAKSGFMLLGNKVELNFDEYYFYLPDGTVFRKPTQLLFSKSRVSSKSGQCFVCNGSGGQIAVNFSEIINNSVPLQKGFLNVPITKAGRYVAFRFLPSGLSTLLKKQGIDVKKTFNELPEETREKIRDVLLKKLLSNKSDEDVKTYLVEAECPACDGTGYSYQSRAVLVNERPFDYYLSLTSNELRQKIGGMELNDAAFKRLDKQLEVIERLAIGHINLNRSTVSISSGEAQRLKLLDVLISHDSGKIIVLDEPSANLQYRDNLAILDAILELKNHFNCVIVVEHNSLYRRIADRILDIGPGAGTEGGYIVELGLQKALKVPEFLELVEPSTATKNLSFKTIPLKPKRNVHLTNIKIPLKKIIVVVGSSGSGKSTLVLDMLYNSLVDSNAPVFKLDSKPPGKSSTSIVGTYLDVFDDVRKVYAKANAPHMSESDFSFNARGACLACGGSGLDGSNVCGVCLGSRYRSDVCLAKADGISIVELLGRNVNHIEVNGEFSFLSEVIRIFSALSLMHITLGRATSSLSGGELQRLKLAKFILNNSRTIGNKLSTVILDEPSRGLDDAAVTRLYKTLTEYLNDCTIIVIEHNPAFIYRCDYVIDLGLAIGDKTQKNIVTGFLGERDFPSLNHSAVFDEVEGIKRRRAHVKLLNIKSISHNLFSEGKRYRFLHPLYVCQKNFELERRFSADFEVDVKDKNFTYFRSRSEMERVLTAASNFLYNPFISHLEKYSKVPASIYKAVITNCRESKIYLSDDPWNTLVKAENFDEAFLKGGGVVATHEGTLLEFDKCKYLGIRFFSAKERLVDGIKPATFAFNLYRNACPQCHGYGHIQSFPFDKWIDRQLSPLDPNMTFLGLSRVMPKAAIAHFAKEQLFDFSLTPAELTSDEYNILLYGFKAYKFKKPGKSGVVEDDFWEWRGLNSYIYNNASKLSPNEDLSSYLQWYKCPFCTFGFKDTVTRYRHAGATFTSHMKNEF